ncbi:unnamed protein product [Linum tenue]|uniref:MADS-box domain-containing protein n=1 Tax=Linum tenue TaxID=586396 RepID=A0AAV0HQZ6_9ROSI|nr:unnamed protein product [Linum tenue]
MDKSNSGRQKIPIRKIPKKNHLQVTFSKRRAGLFKKASELCTLCGIEIAVIVFSPAGKAYSFGHPDVGSVVGRFLAHQDPIPTGGGAHRRQSAVVKAGGGGGGLKNAQLAQILTQLEAERDHVEMVGQVMKAQESWLTRCPVDELGLDGLVRLRSELEELKLNVAKQQRIALMEAAAAASYHSSSQFLEVMNFSSSTGGCKF